MSHAPIDLIPARPTLAALRRVIQQCEGCDLYRTATQAVMGEGPSKARVMLVGEQPGNDEDLQGRPFVGPAGRILERALSDAGIQRETVYVTNSVKHFKFEERGKRRIHKKPNTGEVSACMPWLAAEILTVKPEIIVCLGATAAQALLGRDYRLTKERGTFRSRADGPRITSTIHPSAVLRAPDQDRESMYEGLVADLRKVEREMQPAKTLQAPR
jgi:uracil-DNA glycosylase family protein